VRPKPSPPDLLPDSTAGVFEVSRFSCMKFLGLPGVFDYPGPKPELALALLSMLPSAHVYRLGVRVVCFPSSIAHPAYPLSTLRGLPRHRTRARLEAKWIATPFL